MKALRKVATGQDLELQDVPVPTPASGEVVLKVHATGICGSDLHIQDDEYAVVPPVTIGHETAGVVVDVGPGVSGISPGMRATSKTTISTCGRCDLCLAGRTNLCPERRWLGGHVDGGFASYVCVPVGNVLALPATVSLDAAALTEPLACCVHGVLELGQPRAGEVCVVSGPGPIGLLCAQAARAAGADVIVLGTSADEARFALARDLGFEKLVDVQRQDVVEAVRELAGGRAPQLVVESAGAAASLDQCLRLAPRGGTVLQIGLYGKPVPVPVDTLVLKEVRLVGSFSSTPTSWATSLELMAAGRVRTEPLVTSKRPLEDWAEAFRAARRKGEGKILLVPAES
ncbi:MAG TPA: alcohol dehydrogenase catalytic domain-containing protein [Chloroflexota bacterium]|nr:alcohol dehydrogenase catalytic domain-containing protein [Chloroflexota bacterium]